MSSKGCCFRPKYTALAAVLVSALVWCALPVAGANQVGMRITVEGGNATGVPLSLISREEKNDAAATYSEFIAKELDRQECTDETPCIVGGGGLA